jgi:hypothetical protein
MRKLFDRFYDFYLSCAVSSGVGLMNGCFEMSIRKAWASMPVATYGTPRAGMMPPQLKGINSMPMMQMMVMLQPIREEAEPVSSFCCSITLKMNIIPRINV